MLSFLLLGCIVTLVSSGIFITGLIKQESFLFGPFIATVIGLNYIIISFVQLRRERIDGKR